MATDIPKYIQAVSKLIQLTQEDRLRWLPAWNVPPKEPGTRIGPAFAAQYDDKTLRVYRVAGEVEEGRFFNFRPRVVSIKPRVFLEIVDDQDDQDPIWTFPESPANADLLSAVEHQSAHVEQFLDTLIRE